MPEPTELPQFWIDVGGTFTDCLASVPDRGLVRRKILSSSTERFPWDRSRVDPNIPNAIRLSRADDLVDDFWRGYRVVWLDVQGQIIASGTVGRSRGSILECDLDDATRSIDSAVAFELNSPEPSPLFVARRCLNLALDHPLPRLEMHLGTTRGTNALLTRSGARTALVVTKGFADLLNIGDQTRPHLFDLTIHKPSPLAEQVIEAVERLDAWGKVVVPLDESLARTSLQQARRNGIESVAICLLHGYLKPAHEQRLGELAQEVGFREVSLSHRVSPLIKLLPRAETTVLNAYLGPVIRDYADQIRDRLAPGSRLLMMTSSGGLVPRDAFDGKDSLLSGPAGGVVGFARAAEQVSARQSIGFDMGGTSTDVARYAGDFEMEQETHKAGIRIVTPVLAIETVAAGGGSICDLQGSRLTVGPRSAASDPGPACYGRGGPLTVTDLNVFLGRISERHFPFPVNRTAVRQRLEELRVRLEAATGRLESNESMAEGLLQIANHNMATAIRTVSVARGFDPSDYLLVAFGGAGPQHATRVADELGMDQILIHPNSSVLSAEGIRLADRNHFAMQGIVRRLDASAMPEIQALHRDLKRQARDALRNEGADTSRVVIRAWIDLRYSGTEPSLAIEVTEGANLVDIVEDFQREHERAYGYRQSRPIEMVSTRVEARVPGFRPQPSCPADQKNVLSATSWQTMYSDGAWVEAGRFDWDQLSPGDRIQGPGLIADDTTTIVVDPGWTAELFHGREVVLHRESAIDAAIPASNARPVDQPDPVLLEIMNNSFSSIARQMGVVLQRTSVSVNIRDRLDFSCALFNAAGDLIVNAPHIPVHLGAMSETVRAVIQDNPLVQDGDVFVTNDPYAGGSHLPDVTVVTPVFLDTQVAFWVASRGHHAEIGGKSPGSMPPDAACLEDEGVVIRNLKLIDAGREQFDLLQSILRSGPWPSRSVGDNLADVRAQIAANRKGVFQLRELVKRYSQKCVSDYMNFILDASESQTRDALRKLNEGKFTFSDTMDNGCMIQVAIEKHADRIAIDFAGTDPVSPDNLNANRAICIAAIMYVMRCLLRSSVPLNEGVMRPVQLALPVCFLNPVAGVDARHSPAIVGGNVETSQRIVDVLLGALDLAAASQGTMNNWLMGDETFGYYETLGGGSGATSEGPGADALHTHMTNTRLTDPEVLELRYPVRLLQVAIARGTGGHGRHAGGNGMVREIEFLKALRVSLLTSRRNSRPWGLHGGGPGASGLNLLWRNATRQREALPSRCLVNVEPGDRLILRTPGGGAWGKL